MYHLNEFTKTEKTALWAITLAWCEDNHTAMFSMGKEENEAVSNMLDRFNKDSEAGAGTLADVLTIALTYYKEGLGETDLTIDRWDAIEGFHALLSQEIGHTPRNLNGEIITL